MRKLIVPKRNRPIEKVKKGNDKLETTEELPNLGELYAPLTWAINPAVCKPSGQHHYSH
jgi:hypothetical protein